MQHEALPHLLHHRQDRLGHRPLAFHAHGAQVGAVPDEVVKDRPRLWEDRQVMGVEVRTVKQLVEESARPLRTLERSMAADATGFGTSCFDRWVEEAGCVISGYATSGKNTAE